MPSTARSHFDDDIARAQALLANAATSRLSPALSRDIRMSAVAMAVGALDAYLCDAYVDCLTSALQAHRNGAWSPLPKKYREQNLPAGIVLDSSRSSRPTWAIRMAARKVMERDDMLKSSRWKDSFNPILPSGQKLWYDFVHKMLAYGLKRLTGPLTQSQIAALSGQAKVGATKVAAGTIRSTLDDSIQIRHDWIHNCGRPKTSIQSITPTQAATRIRHIQIFINELDSHIDTHRVA